MAHKPSPRALTEFFAKHTGLARVGTYDQMKEKLKAAGLGIDFNPSYAMNLILDEEIKFWAYTQVQVLPAVGQNGIFYITPDSQMWIWNEQEQTYDPAGGISAVDDDTDLASRNPVQNQVITKRFQKGPFILPASGNVDFKDIPIGNIISVTTGGIKDINGDAIKSADVTKGTIVVDKYGNIAIATANSDLQTPLRVVTKTEKGSEASAIFFSRDFLVSEGSSASHVIARNRLQKLGGTVVPTAEEIIPNKTFLVDINGEMALIKDYDATEDQVHYEKFLGFPAVTFCSDKYVQLSTTIGDVTQVDPYYIQEYRANSEDNIPSMNASQLVPGRTMLVDAFGTVSVFAYKEVVYSPHYAEHFFFRTLAVTGDTNPPVYRSKHTFGTSYGGVGSSYAVLDRWTYGYELQKIAYNGSTYEWVDTTLDDRKAFVPGKTLFCDPSGDIVLYNGNRAMGWAIFYGTLVSADVRNPIWYSPYKLNNKVGETVTITQSSSSDPNLSALFTRETLPNQRIGDIVLDESGTLGVITNMLQPYSSSYRPTYVIQTISTSDLGILCAYDIPENLNRQPGEITTVNDNHLCFYNGTTPIVYSGMPDWRNRLTPGKSLYIDNNGSIGLYVDHVDGMKSRWMTISSSGGSNESIFRLKTGTMPAQPNDNTTIVFSSSPTNMQQFTSSGWSDLAAPDKIVAGDTILDKAGTVAKVLFREGNNIAIKTILSTQAVGIIRSIGSGSELLNKNTYTNTTVTLSSTNWKAIGKREESTTTLTAESLIPGATLIVDRNGTVGVFDTWLNKANLQASFTTLSTSGDDIWTMRTTSYLPTALNSTKDLIGDTLQYDKPNTTPEYDGYSWWTSTPTAISFDDVHIGKTLVYDRYGTYGVVVAKTSDGGMGGRIRVRVVGVASPALTSSSVPIVHDSAYTGGTFHEDGMGKTVKLSKDSISGWNDSIKVEPDGTPLLVTCSDRSIVQITAIDPNDPDFVTGVVLNRAEDMLYNPYDNASTLAFNTTIGGRTTFSSTQILNLEKRDSYNNTWISRKATWGDLTSTRTLAYDQYGTIAILVGRRDERHYDFETITTAATSDPNMVTTDKVDKTLSYYSQIFETTSYFKGNANATSMPANTIKVPGGSSSAVDKDKIDYYHALVFAPNGVGRILFYHAGTDSYQVGKLFVDCYGGVNNPNDPTTWEKNTLINFGDGLSGYRFYGDTSDVNAFNNFSLDGEPFILTYNVYLDPSVTGKDNMAILDVGGASYFQWSGNISSYRPYYLPTVYNPSNISMVDQYRRTATRLAVNIDIGASHHATLSVPKQVALGYTVTAFHWDAWILFKKLS